MNSPESDERNYELLDTLKWWKMEHLYPKLKSQKVTIGVLWELDDDMLKDCKLNRVEKLQYSKAKEEHLNANKGKLEININLEKRKIFLHNSVLRKKYYYFRFCRSHTEPPFRHPDKRT